MTKEKDRQLLIEFSMWLCGRDVKDEAVKYVDRFLSQRESGDGKGRWISVSERLPEKTGRVLALVDGSIRLVAYTKANHVPILGWYCVDGDPEDMDEASNMTHWMPLPEIPKSK